MEAAVESAVVYLLENLLQLIKENYDLISNAGSKVDELSNSLRLLKGFVIVYTENHPDSIILKELAKEIRELIHEAEDAIEEYIYCVSVQNSRRKFKQALHAVAHAIKVLYASKKVEDVSGKVMKMYEKNSQIGKDALRLKATEKGAEIAKKPKPSVPVADKVIGFEDAAIKVINRLTGKRFHKITRAESDSKQNTEIKDLEVVSIVGMLGSGKTTLARKVLADRIIEKEFFPRIFVHVSDEYNKREVFQTILIQGGFFKNIKELNDMSDDELVPLIKDNLKSKYLVVLDDVWTTEAWEDLKGIFPDHKEGSRVLITTRNQIVANYSMSKIKYYNLRFLYPEESRKLFRMKVFDENEFPDDPENLETEILERCKDLPLTIVVTAGTLRSKRKDKNWWKQVSRGVRLSNLGVSDQERSDKLMRMIYDHLPSQLKPCFLYLGVFPEDMEIPVWKLLRLWIAEGFIQKAQDVDLELEEIAELYLGELVDRNLVMEGQRTLTGQIKTCLVHDSLRSFCKRMAIEENLFQEIRNQNATISPFTIPSRRLCVNAHLPDYISEKTSAERVRSFLSFAKDQRTLQKEFYPLIFKAFKLVKVFDINSVKLGDRLPAELRKLVLLKYISISCELSTLPKMMSNLVNLQTIIIDTTSHTLDIQANIWKMKHLRHLHANTSTILPVCEQSSTGLQIQTISAISPESCTREMFKKTPKLKKLGIHGKLSTLVEANGGESNLFDGLLDLQFLEILKVVNHDMNFKLLALPKEDKFPAKLRKLSLQNTKLDWATEMSTLGKLPCLVVLKLKDKAFEGKEWQTEDGGFRFLEVLSIGSTDLEDWKADASNFPVLKCLALKHCSELKVIPAGLADIKSLELIDLNCTNSSVVSSARKIKDTKTGEIKLKVSHPKLHRQSNQALQVLP